VGKEGRGSVQRIKCGEENITMAVKKVSKEILGI
jgi:hypothetical protein